MAQVNQPKNEVQLMTEILSGIVKALVSRPELVTVTPTEHGNIIAWNVRPDQGDVPRVIGKGGKHFRAIETLMGAIAKLIDREAHVVLDDKGIPGSGSVSRTFALGQRSDFSKVLEILRLVVWPFLDEPEKLAISSTEMGKTTIIELKISARDYPDLYGKEMAFEYGPDGHIIGSIKNIFDGIGKNHGRILKIGVSRV